jgi:hypothetical protein
MKKYIVSMLVMLVSAQSAYGAAAQAQKLITAGAKLLWTGTVAGTTCYFAPTIKAAAEQYFRPSTENSLAEAILLLSKQQQVAPSVTAEQFTTIVKEALTASGNAAQPAEYGWSYVGPLLSLMANHKVLSGLIGTIGIGATVYASHEGTRTIVRERISALATALERLKAQLMERMNGIEEQITQGTNAVGDALNESEERNTARFNQLAQFIAATAVAQQQNTPMPEAPVFTAQPVFIAPAAPAHNADNAPLMDAEPRGWFASVRGWVGL